jgi:hypothetical protein
MSSACTGTDGGGPGIRYTFAELEGLWLNAGGSKALAPTMAAIALAESGGCTTDLNTTDNGGTQTSWGLWQISNGTHSSPGADWNTGAGNAALAVAKIKSQGLTAWGTFDSGAYKQFLNGNTPPDTSVNGGATAPGSGSTAGGGATTVAAVKPASCLLFFPGVDVPVVGTVGSGCLLGKSQARAIIGGGFVLAGGAVLMVGALILAAYGLKASGAGRTAASGLELVAGGAEVVGAAKVAGGLRGGARKTRAVS